MSCPKKGWSPAGGCICRGPGRLGSRGWGETESVTCPPVCRAGLKSGSTDLNQLPRPELASLRKSPFCRQGTVGLQPRPSRDPNLGGAFFVTGDWDPSIGSVAVCHGHHEKVDSESKMGSLELIPRARFGIVDIGFPLIARLTAWNTVARSRDLTPL